MAVERSALIAPHGGTLVNRLAGRERMAALTAEASAYVSVELTDRQLCDFELIATGGFSPLSGFMTRVDHDSVCSRMRLANGLLWPIPVALDVPEPVASRIGAGDRLALKDPEGGLLGVLHVRDCWKGDVEAEALALFGTLNRAHAGVALYLAGARPWRVGGEIEAVQLPAHYDFRELRLTPQALRSEMGANGWTRMVAFQTRNPMHRAHQELTRRAVAAAHAHLLIHPVVGMTKPGDVDHFTRVRCYKAVLPTYPAGVATLALLPLAMRMAGPREAIWHALIRQNFGCTHFIVGRDHAGPGKDAAGVPFYDPYAAQHLAAELQGDMLIEVVPFSTMVYLADQDRYVPDTEVPSGERVLDLSGTELRRLLASGSDVPGWFTFPDVVAELRRSHPPRRAQGVTVFFTGLSGSGKSTTANVLLVKLQELGGRRVTLLDGDLVRKQLSSELGFSREHRDLNIRRIGFVASEITKNGGLAICAPIAPYAAVRREVREMVEAVGGFVLVHMSTPIETCEARDRKGLYAKARAGLLPQFTGISDPYEPPDDADLTIDAAAVSPEQAADAIVDLLGSRGYI